MTRDGPSTPVGDDVVLEVEDLQTGFVTDAGVVRAVNGVSLRLLRHRALGIVGESGSGKSVLSRSIMNLLADNAVVSDGSKIRFEGREIQGLSAKEGRRLWGAEIGMIFQDPMTSLNPVLTVGRQVAEPLELHQGLSRRAALARAVDLLAQVGISDPARRVSQHPHNLSGGMRQRVGIAMALACGPKLLIADEPTTALDVTIQRQILDLLQSLQQDNGMAMVLVTHDLGVVASRTDDIAVMYGGTIVERAPTRDLFRNPRHPYTAALLQGIPRVEQPSHTRLSVIPGRPPVLLDTPQGCVFAHRCKYTQPRCLEVSPSLDGMSSGHEHACFFPVGSDQGADALARNLAAGQTATGRRLTADEGQAA